MKNLILIAILNLAVFAFAGCRNETANTTDITANKATPANTSATNSATTPAANPSPTKSAPTSDLKPEDVSADKSIPAEELNAAFIGNEEAWKGKEVTVVGRYHSTTTSKLKSGDQIRIDISDDKGKKMIGCVVKQDIPEEVAKGERKGRVFKGTVKDKFFSQVELDPCEFVK